MKAQKFAVLAFIAMLLLTSMSAVVRAQDDGSTEADQSAQASSATTNPEQAQADKDAAA